MFRHLKLTKGLVAFREANLHTPQLQESAELVAPAAFVRPSSKAMPRPPSPLLGTSAVKAEQAAESVRIVTAEPPSSQESPLPSSLAMTSPAESPQGSPTMLTTLQNIQATIADFNGARPRDPAFEVPLPKVTIIDEAMQWSADSLSKESRRHTWPIRHQADIDDIDFQRFLKSRALSQQSVDIYTQGVRYFFNMFDISVNEKHVSIASAENSKLIGFFVVLYTENVMTTAFELPLLNTEYPWTRKIIDSVSLMLDFLGIECNRRRLDEAGRCLQLLAKEYFNPKKRSGYKERKVGMMQKKQSDAERLKHMPSVPEIKKA